MSTFLLLFLSNLNKCGFYYYFLIILHNKMTKFLHRMRELGSTNVVEQRKFYVCIWYLFPDRKIV